MLFYSKVNMIEFIVQFQSIHKHLIIWFGRHYEYIEETLARLDSILSVT